RPLAPDGRLRSHLIRPSISRPRNSSVDRHARAISTHAFWPRPKFHVTDQCRNNRARKKHRKIRPNVPLRPAATFRRTQSAHTPVTGVLAEQHARQERSERFAKGPPP